MDVVWKANLVGESHGFATRNADSCPDFNELREEQKNVDAWYVEYADTLGTVDIDEMVDFEHIGGGAGRMKRGEVVHHVINHTTYHRGHIEGAMYQIPAEPPTTDLSVYVRDLG